MYIYSHTNTKHTPQWDPHTWCTNKSNAYLLKHTPQVFCLYVIHVTVSTLSVVSMPTYLRALSPAKTEAGSEDSWLWLRESSLWGGGRTQSDLHSFTISASLHVRQCIQCVCARVSVSVLYTCLPQGTTTSIEHTSQRSQILRMQGICIQSCGHTRHMETSNHMSML